MKEEKVKMFYESAEVEIAPDCSYTQTTLETCPNCGTSPRMYSSFTYFFLKCDCVEKNHRGLKVPLRIFPENAWKKYLQTCSYSIANKYYSKLAGSLKKKGKYPKPKFVFKDEL